MSIHQRKKLENSSIQWLYLFKLYCCSKYAIINCIKWDFDRPIIHPVKNIIFHLQMGRFIHLVNISKAVSVHVVKLAYFILLPNLVFLRYERSR